MIKTNVAPALKCLLENVFDYAGLFPPAKLPLDVALSAFNQYRGGDQSWMLRNFVVPSKDLGDVPESFNGSLSVLADSDEPRAASLETTRIVSADRPVYCEISALDPGQMDAIKESGCFAKIRCGGVRPDAIPSAQDIAAFINACAERRLPFKATAGLHHPVRAEQTLTYENDSPRAVMHGFLNVLLAASFSWHGERDIEAILAETDPGAFSFDERVRWRDKSLSSQEIIDARSNFFHSIGSCSFEEPVHDLKGLGLL